MPKSKKKQVKRLAAPKHLTKPAAAWWGGVMADYELEAHHVILLTLAAEAWQRAVQARKRLRKYGLIYTDRFGSPKPRPEVSIERDSRLAFARLLRELALDVSEPGENRPPSITGNSNLRK